jgi:predicted membrane protein
MMEVAPFTGYVYPNETIIQWGVLIVIYPYLTGLVAGAFTVSSFYHVFGMKQFKPVARLALLTSLSLMLFVPSPLLLHLGHPERSMLSMITPHLTSAFAMFGFFAAFYTILLMLECWFVFRADNVRRSLNSTGLTRSFYRAITLWSDDLSPRARAIDAKWGFNADHLPVLSHRLGYSVVDCALRGGI